LVQVEQEKYMTPLPNDHQHGVRFINSYNCNIHIQSDAISMDLLAHDATNILIFEEHATFSYMNCEGITEDIPSDLVRGEPGKSVNVILSPTGHYSVPLQTDKAEDCTPKLSCLNTLRNESVTLNINNQLHEISPESLLSPVLPREKQWSISLENHPNEVLEINPGCGGIYSVVVEELEDSSLVLQQLTDVNPSVVSVAWIFPQYFIITCAEILVSITALEFSYTQAPPSMKSVLSAVNLLTVSFGNVIVLIVAEARGFDQQSSEFFLFAGLVTLAGCLFAFLAYRYVPVDEKQFAAEILKERERMKQRSQQYNKKRQAKKQVGPIDDDVDEMAL